MKVLLVASTGGHFQAMQKLRLFWENHNCCWVTFRTPETQEILQDYPVYWAYAPTNRNIPNLSCIIHEDFGKSSKALARSSSSDLAEKQSVF